MNVLITFDVEVWCDGWDSLDKNFSMYYDRYVYGNTPYGKYSLPKTLEILEKNNLKAVFFVEPLFSARFGIEFLEKIVSLIQNAGQEVQLHLHPEWTNEISPPIIKDCHVKRQHLSYYTLEEQTVLIKKGLELLLLAGSKSIVAFRAGSYAFNEDTLKAIKANGFLFDSSFNVSSLLSGAHLRDIDKLSNALKSVDLSEYPISNFIDGFSNLRHAQIGACSLYEMQDALLKSAKLQADFFVIVSHNFEMLKQGLTNIDKIVVKRFEGLCAFLNANREKFVCCGFNEILKINKITSAMPIPRISLSSTTWRYIEQGTRRIFG